MRSVLSAGWAELAQLDTVWIITTVLPGDVVTSLAIAAGENDLRTDVCAFFSHSATPCLVGTHPRLLSV